MTNVWQNILACDALCNAYRAPNNPCLSRVYFVTFAICHLITCGLFLLETLYLRRRALLLQEKAASSTSSEEGARKSYLQLRSTILWSRYGIPKEVLYSSRSRSVSLRGMNVSTSENKNSLGSSHEDRYMAVQQMLDHVRA